MKSVAVHGALLMAALLTAFVTWTANDRPAADDAAIVVWDRGANDVASLAFQNGPRMVELERRGTGDQAHIWGKETIPEPAAPPPVPPVDTTAADTAAADTAAAVATPAPPAVRTEEFPAGGRTDEVFEKLAAMRAVRDLGDADDAKRKAYGLDKQDMKLTVRFRDREERVFIVGNTVVGGTDRYALDTESDHIYVLGADLLQPLESGSSALRLAEYQSFEPNRVSAVAVRAAGVDRRMERRSAASPTQIVWAEPGSDQPDQAFSNFMEQLQQLWVSRFAPEIKTDALDSVLRIQYFDDDGDTLGFLELFRSRGAPETRKYYMQTPRTMVPGEIYTPLGERIEQDAATLLRGRPQNRVGP
jgi:hypothetical protein